MSFIHQPIINRIARTLLRPFSPILPASMKFAIDGTVTVQLGEGRTMKFHGNVTSPFTRILFWDGVKGYEPDEYRIFVPLVKRSHLFFDVGANIGYYSLVAQAFHPEMEVHGFEPMPSANKFFKINKEINGYKHLFIHDLALSDRTGNATFHSNLNPKFPHITDHLYGDSSLNDKATSRISRITIEVKTDTLDHFCATHLRPEQTIDLMKIDTEATEHLVLAGAQEVLTRHRPIIMCEVIKGFIEAEIEKALLAHRYVFFQVGPKGLTRSEKVTVEKGKTDYFFVPEEKVQAVKDLTV